MCRFIPREATSRVFMSSVGEEVLASAPSRKPREGKKELDMKAAFNLTYLCFHRVEVIFRLFKQFPARTFNGVSPRVDHSARNLKCDIPRAVAKLFIRTILSAGVTVVVLTQLGVSTT